MHSLQDLRMTSFLWQWCIRKRKEKNARLGWILCLHTDIYLYEILKIFKKQDKNKQTKKKTLGKRKHTSTAMNVDGGWGRSSQPVTFWLSDDVMCTACCRRVRATAWPAFCKHHPWEQATPTHPHLHTTTPPPSTHKAGPLISSLWNANTTSSLLHQHGYDWTFSSPPPPPAAMHIWKNSRGPVDAGSIFLKRWRWWENKVVVVVGGGGGQDFYCTAKQLHCGGLLIRRTTQPGEDVCRTGVLFRNTLFSSRKKKIKWTS